MEIEKYFKNLEDSKISMETAYKNYIEHIQLRCDISGISYKEIMVKSTIVPKGLDSKLIDDEDFAEEYKKKYIDYKMERENCLKDINKLESRLHRLIIEYTYINKESTKELCNTLRTYHKLDYMENTIEKQKTIAKKLFEKIIEYHKK